MSLINYVALDMLLYLSVSLILPLSNRNNNSNNAISIGLHWELNELIYKYFAQLPDI